MDWQIIMERELTENTVRELYLYQIPLLKTCDNWGAVKEIGRVDFKGKHANYHGGLVKYAGKIFFVPDARLEALASYRKWDFRNKLRVITEAEVKKSRK